MTNRRIINIEQVRAKRAYAFVDKVNKGDLENIKKFGRANIPLDVWEDLSIDNDLRAIIESIGEKQDRKDGIVEFQLDIEKVSKEIREELGKEIYLKLLQYTPKLNKIKSEYKSGLKKFPVYVKTNGLGQTLAFIKNRNDGYDLIYRQLVKWLKKDTEQPNENGGDLIEEVISLDSSTYRQVTIEVLAFSNWMRRFVDGLMKDVEAENG